MEKHFVTPKFPLGLTLGLLLVVLVELAVYGVVIAIPALWFALVFGGFYLSYVALLRHDVLPLVFVSLFLTAHHTLFFNYHSDMPMALLFLIIFGVNSIIMWLLLHYATHLKPEYHMAYSLMSGFMIAQILTLFASMAKDWSFRFELASYVSVVFSYSFWRFACLAADSLLTSKQFLRVAVVVIILIVAIILGSPNVQV
ncbi:MAG TPA: hypothetical protein VGE59_00490 [Patescibacteria group bacterium]